jgi:hypothetical protein
MSGNIVPQRAQGWIRKERKADSTNFAGGTLTKTMLITPKRKSTAQLFDQNFRENL